MEVQELRIGNSLLLYNEVVKVTEIGFKDDDFYLCVEGKNNGYYIDQFEPIELSEEILLKYGFITYNKTSFLIEDCPICIRIESKEIEVDSYLLNGNKFYLHQLQNLYWCLVGKELNIEL